jgi:hypothetical protein
MALGRSAEIQPDPTTTAQIAIRPQGETPPNLDRRQSVQTRCAVYSPL